ncbi:MAG TPA: hypothetical protein VKG26_02610 [Bacteroidia bacterium]|nr:hypothetical protein [Bacteroidia bacterium]
MKSSTKITYKNGFFFPLGGQIFAYVLLFIAFLALSSHTNIVQACVAMAALIGGFLLLSTKGLDIDIYAKILRPYTKVLGIKTGKEIPLSNFKFITIINQSYSQSSFSRTSVEVKSTFSTCNILLVDETHHVKQFVQSFDTYEEALEEAKKLSKQLNFEIVKYDPVRTRGRRK